MISVIIPTYRNPTYLDICIDSALRNQDGENEIVVVVDGYYEESADVLSKYPDISTIDLETNHGMQYAINFGVWNCLSDQIFVVNDDNVFPMSWDTKLSETYSYNRITTANQIEPVGPSMFNFEIYDCGKTAEEFDMEKFIDIESGLSEHKVSMGGSIFPFHMNKRWFMAVGGFDSWFVSPNYCDWDFFAKLQLIPNLEFYRSHLIHLYHFGSVATRKTQEARTFVEKAKIAEVQYEYKWKFPPYNGPNNEKFPPNKRMS
jgi:glycosyltransferase involved in cell wall biosynthesis